MIVCESQFRVPDRDNPAIALHEVDFYQSGDHRLSLRYRFDPARYEVYRKMYADDTEQLVFAFPDLQLALDAGGTLWSRKFSSDREADQVCRHEYPVKAHGCKVNADAD